MIDTCVMRKLEMAGLQPTADIRSPHLITIFWFWRLLVGIKKQQVGVIQETCSYLARSLLLSCHSGSSY
ncbi:hypothetical protein GDO78_022430 [Eleutherodactylus coqui]|uniref:Uncharacterized protein n=1 Tax=Eleutherodactylus coqui TaxID=57060 RepID=A0A8J6JYG3_ELECQ|nr:hypothetical protein GDO78_022430 [Eleutherodactylus coqui]